LYSTMVKNVVTQCIYNNGNPVAPAFGCPRRNGKVQDQFIVERETLVGLYVVLVLSDGCLAGIGAAPFDKLVISSTRRGAHSGKVMLLFGVNNSGVPGKRDDRLCRNGRTPCVGSSVSSSASLAGNVARSLFLGFGGGGSGGNLPFPSGSGDGSVLRRSKGRSREGACESTKPA